METAAAILTKAILDNNTALRSRVAACGGNAVDFATIILPIYLGMLDQLRRQTPPAPPQKS